jgi:hypothetical protein
MIATGNHLDFDSLRGAPLPEGEARGAVEIVHCQLIIFLGWIYVNSVLTGNLCYGIL